MYSSVFCSTVSLLVGIQQFILFQISDRANRTQCCQRLATAATFLRMKLRCPGAMTRRLAPPTRYSLRRNTASIMKDLICHLNKIDNVLKQTEVFDRHLRVIAPAGNKAPFEEMSQRWRAVGTSDFSVPDLIGPKFEPQTSCSRDDCVTTSAVISVIVA